MQSSVNKVKQEKKDKHHTSGSKKIIQITKEHRDKSSKHPYLDASATAYVTTGLDNEASQSGARFIELAQQELANTQFIHPDLSPEDLPHLSRESQIAIADEV